MIFRDHFLTISICLQPVKTEEEIVDGKDLHPGNRITSYNVCYTKLLREVAEPLAQISVGHLGHADPVVDLNALHGRFVVDGAIELVFEVPSSVAGASRRCSGRSGRNVSTTDATSRNNFV